MSPISSVSGDAPLLAAAQVGAGSCLAKCLIIRYSNLVFSSSLPLPTVDLQGYAVLMAPVHDADSAMLLS